MLAAVVVHENGAQPRPIGVRVEFPTEKRTPGRQGCVLVVHGVEAEQAHFGAHKLVASLTMFRRRGTVRCGRAVGQTRDELVPLGRMGNYVNYDKN